MSLEALQLKVNSFESNWLKRRVTATLKREDLEEVRLNRVYRQIRSWEIAVYLFHTLLSLMTVFVAGIVYKKLTGKGWFNIENVKAGRLDVKSRLGGHFAKFTPEDDGESEKEILITQRLGAGAFGEVSRAIVSDGEYKEIDVAIKVAKNIGFFGVPGLTVENEAEALKQLDHPNIVQVVITGNYGVNFAMGLEYADKGTLQTFVSTPQYTRMTWNDGRKAIALNVAHAIRYLHIDQNKLHRDIKSANVLVFSNEDGTVTAKLADFGGLIDINQATDASTVATVNWAAPEVLSNLNLVSNGLGILGGFFGGSKKNIGTATDVWSYGTLLWQMNARKIPYLRFAIGGVGYSLEMLESGYREKIPKKTPQKIAHLIRACWEQDPNDRPPMDDVIETLEDNNFTA